MSDLLNAIAPLVGVVIGWALTRGRGVPFVPAPTIASFDPPTTAELSREAL